jgi:hypothetical protein
MTRCKSVQPDCRSSSTNALAEIADKSTKRILNILLLLRRYTVCLIEKNERLLIKLRATSRRYI